MLPNIDRRTLLTTGLAAALATCAVVPAGAQTITDQERTRWLRDGVGSSRRSEPRGSALPPTGLRVLDGADREVFIEIDPRRSVDMSVYFSLDSAALEPRAVDGLAWLGRALRTELLGRRFLLAGHTDVTGSHDHNVVLSLARARSVRDHLVTRWGIDPATLYVAGYGPDHLRDPSRPAAAVNRRVEIVAVRDILR
jgi:outer membrane protein OmpA-like peptidoglycan-associated protein